MRQHLRAMGEGVLFPLTITFCVLVSNSYSSSVVDYYSIFQVSLATLPQFTTVDVTSSNKGMSNKQ